MQLLSYTSITPAQLGVIFFILGILVFVGLFLYAPFLERRARRVAEEEQEISTLMAERERTISALQELDFDYKLGKVPDEDYPVQRANLLQNGADILRKLDELTTQKKQDDTDTRLERAIAAHRRKVASKKQNITDDEIESLVAARRKGRRTKTGGF